MREAKIIVPVNDNTGALIPSVTMYARDALIDAFGGCTIREAEGCWFDRDAGELYCEPVRELIVACDPMIESVSALRRIAREVGRRAKQQSVYVRFASGDVELVETSQLWS